MRTPPLLRNESAFTLVEIMVASAIMLVLALAVSTLLYNSSTQQSKIEDRANDVAGLQETATSLRLKPVPSP
jgi:prepilin-type N-terminal cleavage/methylation domain-containing protein